jgi:hypothetical protein
MFASRIRPATRLQQRSLARSASISSSSSAGGSSVPPSRPSYFSRQTLYPFLLLSTITSLALNLSHSRSQRQQETSQLAAQITVLEAVVARLQQRSWRQLSEEDKETVERELELVGLGRGKGKAKIEHDEVGETSWGEVLFGKKGKAYEPEKDDTDWEKGEPPPPVFSADVSLIPSALSSLQGCRRRRDHKAGRWTVHRTRRGRINTSSLCTSTSTSSRTQTRTQASTNFGAEWNLSLEGSAFIAILPSRLCEV